MEEVKSQPYIASERIKSEQIPNDSITIILKAGGKTYFKGVYLEPSVERSAILAGNLIQTVVDTIDAKGIKSKASLQDAIQGKLDDDHGKE